MTHAIVSIEYNHEKYFNFALTYRWHTGNIITINTDPTKEWSMCIWREPTMLLWLLLTDGCIINKHYLTPWSVTKTFYIIGMVSIILKIQTLVDWFMAVTAPGATNFYVRILIRLYSCHMRLLRIIFPCFVHSILPRDRMFSNIT